MSTSHTTSWTLAMLNVAPKTVCASCPNAVWQQVLGQKGARVYCRLMHVLVDENLANCDGNPPVPEVERLENTLSACLRPPVDPQPLDKWGDEVDSVVNLSWPDDLAEAGDPLIPDAFDADQSQ